MTLYKTSQHRVSRHRTAAEQKRAADADLMREIALYTITCKLDQGEISKSEAVAALRAAYRQAFLFETQSEAA